MQKLAYFLLSVFLSGCMVKKQEASSTFEQVYVLSLDRTPARYKEVKENLDKAKLKHIRFSASDGYLVGVQDKLNKKTITTKEMWNTCKTDMSKKYLYEITCDQNPQNNILVPACRTPGEIGVFCSMRRIWRDIIINNYNPALILEDDAKIIPKHLKNFKKQTAAMMDNAPLGWDIIFLHLYNRHEKLYPARKIGSKEVNEFVWGINRDPNLSLGSTAAYIITPRFANKMLEYTNIMRLPIDMQIAEGINNSIITAYKSKDSLIVPDEKELNSVIKEMGRSESGELK